MYQEDIAKLTADHLREHIGGLLAEITAEYADDPVTLVLPKSIITTGNIGAISSDFDKTLPAYTVDIMEKNWAPDPENMWLYEYAGSFSGMVKGNSDDNVSKLVKRHARAVERFVRSHDFLHQYENADFKLQRLFFVNSITAGATEVQESPPIWVDAFKIDAIWVVSEDGPYDHA